MKELFIINPGKTAPGQEKLSIRLGDRHCSYAITDRSGNELYELVFCSLDHLNENSLSAFRSAYPRIAQPYGEVNITFDGTRATLMPSFCYRPEENRQLLASLHGDTYGCHVMSEPLHAWQMHNVFCIPRDVHDWMTQQYPTGSIRHQYSLYLKNLPAKEEGCILVDFRPHELSVLAGRGGRFLLAQTFNYEEPADVLYHLLRICRQFDLNPGQVRLRVSGLVDRSSSLFQGMEQYILNLELREATWTDQGSSAQPQFFTSLNDVALCAS